MPELIALEALLRNRIAVSEDPDAVIEHLKTVLHQLSRGKQHPVGNVRWVHIDRVQANDYNPNSMAETEMRLLHTSISHDGYTQPVVTVYDPETDSFIIVDGFHRYFTMRSNKDIWDTTGGYLPIVAIDKPINDRMASTIRHNRARGKHSVAGMSSMAFKMLDNGWSDAEICNELGMEPEELLRLKHITGFSALFKNTEYSKEWRVKSQIHFRKRYLEEHPGEELP